MRDCIKKIKAGDRILFETDSYQPTDPRQGLVLGVLPLSENSLWHLVSLKFRCPVSLEDSRIVDQVIRSYSLITKTHFLPHWSTYKNLKFISHRNYAAGEIHNYLKIIKAYGRA